MKMTIRILLPALAIAAAGCGGRTTRDIARGELEQTLRRHDNAVFSIAFHPDGTYLASASRDGKVRVTDWNDPGKNVVKEFEGETKTAYPVAFSPDGSQLLIGGRNARVINTEDWSEVGKFKGHSWVYDFAFSPDGKMIATAGGNDKSVRVWDAATCQRLQKLTPHQTRTFGVAFDRGGGYLVTAGQDRKIKAYRIAQGWTECAVMAEHTASVVSITASPTENLFVSTSFNGEVFVLDVGDLDVRRRLKRHATNATCVCFSKDGRFMATGSWDNMVYLYDRRRGNEPVRRYENKGGRVNGVAISPDGSAIVAASEDGTLRVWRVPEKY
jgi:WD40 repeat protein